MKRKKDNNSKEKNKYRIIIKEIGRNKITVKRRG